MSIGTRLKELRDRDGLSQKQAACRVGMQQQAWRIYETDSSMPGAKLIMKICSEYNVSSDWLLGLKDNAAPTVTAGDGAAVAIGTNARATAITNPGENPACAKCPYKKKLLQFEALLNK